MLAGKSLWSRIQPLLKHVERPSRYIGSEWVAKSESSDAGAEEGNLGDVSASLSAHDADSTYSQEAENVLTFCMIYPDTYELGQPNQALRILVNAVNREEGMYAERAFLPAPDMIELMRKEHIPLFSLESTFPVRDFDVVGITLPHELAATNVLEALDVAGIPLHADERKESDPIVIAGGPCAYNPEPYAAFFDAFTIGEGEEATPETLRAIKAMREAGLSRKEILHGLAKIPGTYVPLMYEMRSEEEANAHGSWLSPLYPDVPSVIEKRIYEGFANSDAWEDMVVPYAEIIHDRLNVEILRGCARGCRFCQAGMMYRPVRERSADNIVSAVLRGVAETGYEEVSLTSLSSTDHSQIAEILTRLNAAFAHEGVRISLPSQRLDSFGVEMAGLVAGRKKGGLTFAPEAGTQRLRDVINKNVTEHDLLSACEAAMEEGWRRIKLYFMMGLPTERDEDLEGIAELANKTYEVMRQHTPPEERGSLRLSVSVAVFVPKAQTPFQWDGQITSEEALRRIGIVRKNLRYKAINLSYHEPKTSMIEAVMSRGGRNIAELVECAWRKGARFDAWTELFCEQAWTEAAAELGIDMAEIAHQTFAPGALLPWAHISCGVSPEYLVKERTRAEREETTRDCTFDACTNCGVCPSLSCANELQDIRETNGEGD